MRQCQSGKSYILNMFIFFNFCSVNLKNKCGLNSGNKLKSIFNSKPNKYHKKTHSGQVKRFKNNVFDKYKEKSYLFQTQANNLILSKTTLFQKNSQKLQDSTENKLYEYLENQKNQLSNLSTEIFQISKKNLSNFSCLSKSSLSINNSKKELWLTKDPCVKVGGNKIIHQNRNKKKIISNKLYKNKFSSKINLKKVLCFKKNLKKKSFNFKNIKINFKKKNMSKGNKFHINPVMNDKETREIVYKNIYFPDSVKASNSKSYLNNILYFRSDFKYS